jgi:hypothetical protein
MPHDDAAPDSGSAIVDLRLLGAILFSPPVVAVLLAACAQSLSSWGNYDVVEATGGPIALILRVMTLLYALFGLAHTVHAVADRLTGRTTPLWWSPTAGDEEDDLALAAYGDQTRAATISLFPRHVDGAALCCGGAFAAWTALSLLI